MTYLKTHCFVNTEDSNSHPEGNLASTLNPDGWFRIGAVCSSGRRSLWLKLIWAPGARRDVMQYEDVVEMHLCAGREGGDAWVVLTRDNPQFYELYQLRTTALYAAHN